MLLDPYKNHPTLCSVFDFSLYFNIGLEYFASCTWYDDVSEVYVLFLAIIVRE